MNGHRGGGGNGAGQGKVGGGAPVVTETATVKVATNAVQGNLLRGIDNKRYKIGNFNLFSSQ